MKARLIALTVSLGTTAAAFGAVVAPQVLAPVSAPTLSEWGLVGLGLIVAIAAGVSIKRRK